MRQLVSVVTDDSIAYLVHDGDETTQIAKVINPGLDITSVITLGVNLGDVLALNGQSTPIAERVVASREHRALPPAKTQHQTKRYKLKADEPVQCTVCELAIKRRHGYAPHLMSVHKWAKDQALLEARTCRSTDPLAKSNATLIDDANAAHSGSRSAPRAQPVARTAALQTWPHSSADDVLAEIRRAGVDGISTREIAAKLTDQSGRGRQTIGNRLQTLRQLGAIETFDGVRPHFKTGKPTPTMLIRAT